IARNIEVNLDENGIASVTAEMINDNSADNCGIASLSLDITSFSGADLGENEVILTVTDNSGNRHTATATVTVIDEIDPVIAGPADITTDTDAEICGAVVNYNYPVITDNASLLE